MNDGEAIVEMGNVWTWGGAGGIGRSLLWNAKRRWICYYNTNYGHGYQGMEQRWVLQLNNKQQTTATKN